MNVNIGLVKKDGSLTVAESRACFASWKSFNHYGYDESISKAYKGVYYKPSEDIEKTSLKQYLNTVERMKVLENPEPGIYSLCVPDNTVNGAAMLNIFQLLRWSTSYKKTWWSTFEYLVEEGIDPDIAFFVQFLFSKTNSNKPPKLWPSGGEHTACMAADMTIDDLVYWKLKGKHIPLDKVEVISHKKMFSFTGANPGLGHCSWAASRALLPPSKKVYGYNKIVSCLTNPFCDSSLKMLPTIPDVIGTRLIDTAFMNKKQVEEVFWKMGSPVEKTTFIRRVRDIEKEVAAIVKSQGETK